MTAPWTTIDEASRDVGTFYVACQRLDGAGSFRLRETEVVPIASMYKVLLALEVADAFASGELRADAEVRVTRDQHSAGGVGLNQLAHPVSISLADLLYLSLAWSDNTATDVLHTFVDPDAPQARAHKLGLDSVQVVGPCRALLRNAGEDFGYPSEAAAIEGDWTPTTDDTDLVLDRTTRGSVADLARLATLVDREQAAQPEACRLVGDIMRRQVWTARLASSFPRPAWSLASKTGTLSPWRGELGTARTEGAHVAIALVVRQHRAATPGEIVDRAVAAVARSAAELASSATAG